MLKTDKHSLQTVPCLDAFNTYSLHLPMVLTQNFFVEVHLFGLMDIYCHI